MTETSLKEESEGKENESKLNSKQNLISQKTNETRPKYLVPCRVNLLDGAELKVDVSRTSKAQELLDKVSEQLNLKEKEYFSCNYKEREKRVWLNHEKKLSDQLKKGSWVVNFEVKFYPPSPSSLNDDITRYLLYLQIRRDILSERLTCSFVSQALLGSYVVQSELGDYEHDEHGPGFNYVKAVRLSINQSDELLEKVADLHRTHRGQAPSVSESKYLENAKNLALYGVHMHPAKDKDEVDILVGVHWAGLLIYKDQLRITRCTWPMILKISYKRSNFYIKYRPSEVAQPEKVVGFRLSNYKDAKRLWKIAVEHHAFFRLKETDPPQRNPFPPFNPKFRYSGRTQYQTRQASLGEGSRPSSTLDRPIASRQSYTATPTSVPTTPVGTYRSTLDRDSYRPLEDGHAYTPYGTAQGYGTAPGYGTPNTTLGKQRPGVPSGPVPVARIDDDAGDVVSPSALTDGKGGPTSGVLPKYSSYHPVGGSQPGFTGGRNSQIENVKLIIQEPERQKAVLGPDRKVYYVTRPDPQNVTLSHPYATIPGRTSSPAGGSSKLDHSGRPISSCSGSEVPAIVTKNVLITATLNKGRGAAGSGSGLDTAGKPAVARTYTAPDGSVITEYATDDEGLVETHIEKRLVVSGDDAMDHDKALAEAIRSVTNMNPDLSVEKIEIQTKVESDL